MKWCREEYIELMTFGRVERQMFIEWIGPMIGLAEEWSSQGASKEEIELTAFNFDYLNAVGCGGKTGLWGGMERRVIEDTDEYIIQIDNYGRKTKLCKKAPLSHFLWTTL